MSSTRKDQLEDDPELLSSYDYPFDSSLIADAPLAERDSSRLLVYAKGSGELKESRFNQIDRFLDRGDLLIVNDSRVIPARLKLKTDRNQSLEVFFVEKRNGNPVEIFCLVRPRRKLKPGEVLRIDDRYSIEYVGPESDGGVFRCLFQEDIYRVLDRYGRVPLPPYIDREDRESDRDRYQTVYADVPGSVAAPTAGLHFSERLLERLEAKGVEIAKVTLFVGPGTFLPVREERLERVELHSELVRIKREALEKIERASGTGRRVVCVGTTSLRAVESLAGSLIKGEGDIEFRTRLFIRPGRSDGVSLYRARYASHLITNFHLPKSSLYILVCGLIGIPEARRIYRYAVENRFRFYSYGDAMMIQLG